MIGVFLRSPGLDVFLPLDHVGGRKRRGDDRELALVAQDLGGVIHERLADALRRRLIDEEVARVGLGVGIPGDDLDPSLAGLPQDGGDSFPVFDGNRDDVDAARDPGFDDFVLLGRVWIGRARPR